MSRNVFLLLCLLFALTATLGAQRTEDQARDDLRYGSDNRRGRVSEAGQIWYGTGAQVGFSSFDGVNNLRLGLSPMVGYKLNNFLSVGPRASLLYNRFGFSGTSESFITWSAGVFTRAKVFRSVFAQVEYSAISDVYYDRDPNTGAQVRRRRLTSAPFAGAGFSQGGGPGLPGFEIVIMFRLTQPEYLGERSYDFRTGFNFNF
jgi:hypothetical protein